MKCDCKEWKENIEILNGATTLAHLHGMEYNGKLFTYCPWCGKKLEDDISR